MQQKISRRQKSIYRYLKSGLQPSTREQAAQNRSTQMQSERRMPHRCFMFLTREQTDAAGMDTS